MRGANQRVIALVEEVLTKDELYVLILFHPDTLRQLLRNLACFGDYRITEVIDVCEDIDDDLYDEADEGDILFMTNLPSEIYDRL